MNKINGEILKETMVIITIITATKDTNNNLGIYYENLTNSMMLNIQRMVT